MTYNLLYIDDDPKDSIVDGFNTTGLIHVTAVRPTSFEKQLAELFEDGGKYQGLILDLKLDENLSGDRKAYYSATTLAQQLRTKVSEGEWSHEMPLILFTTQQKMNAAFSGDTLSKQLFDILFTKERITDKKLQVKIHAIAEAYFTIARWKPNIAKMLDLENLEGLDKRIFSEQLITGEGTVSYSYSKHILDELIRKPGPLIDESYLAARLGIDIKQSETWSDFAKEHLQECKYTGVFSSGWNRWWMHKLNKWWEVNVEPQPLATLDARDRVEMLNKKFDGRLVVADPLPKATSYRYWAICQGYNQPLDPREGLRIDGPEPLPWQDTKYMSIEAALERVKRDAGLRIHPGERERYRNILNSLQ
ncbi:hypothetical protein [Algoriphagus terrigena]|uniref:hypothetical protein n=1 Tax=Algoriphagus terrigena TaxID=344884 RepID=UPI000416A9A8|nr:hypothetical protein [Algoriphagus terrigena]